MKELKPCPFCGNNNLLEVRIKDHGNINRPYGYRYTGEVTCLSCFASVVSHGFEATAEEAEQSVRQSWNRRTENG